VLEHITSQHPEWILRDWYSLIYDGTKNKLKKLRTGEHTWIFLFRDCGFYLSDSCLGITPQKLKKVVNIRSILEQTRKPKRTYLKPWQDPESLFCDTEFLKKIIGKEPAKGKECKE
jgi:hypothetical protein